MSALANTRVNQTRINEQADISVQDDMVEISNTSISVIARIDYIQRFSKQMTVVVDKNSAVYSKVARQYLANISQESSNQEMNVAFVAASSKINDIQMRCRVIEQLFANTLFDPEQSLAVSILRLAKQNNGIITVVVEHAQALSLQIKYELCQLVDTAKKTQNNINVVIFGLEQAAIEIGQNKTIFDKKASIIDASSGQVVSLDHARFKNKSAMFKNNTWLKISLASLFTLLIILVFWFLFSEYKSFNFTTLPITPSVTKNPIPVIVPEKVNTLATQNKLASVSEVHLALLAQDSSQHLLLAKADNGDILQALMLPESTVNDNQVASSLEESTLTLTKIQVTAKQIKSNDVKLEKLSDLTALPVSLNEQYYLNSEKGYVVQITGFSHLSRLEEFIKQNKDLEYFSYEKTLNTKKFYVLTSKVFSDKTQAIEAMNKLPQAIKNLGSFLKSVSTIKREINTVNQ
ncbi:SPOR domain-containing protein [Candidatus Colwellia aromaticivorans]|uniref:SPOR domain-containing protein n=1 Tax=Candidatus Colwellia aromaticivorans TaxID=2267621 RepID=UPI000DF1F152|nr:SPOR domain-containing protein [Candidatus Colwellia aromaticivorans]